MFDALLGRMPLMRMAKPAGIWLALLVASSPLTASSPWSIVWTAPLLLLASMFIAWAAESAQYFIAQGFALAILAWLQTLPEFAVEAVLAWDQRTPLLLSNLTGALRLLTGFGWPFIYAVAAFYHRKRIDEPLRRIRLDKKDSVQVVSLLGVLTWVFVLYFKGSLNLVDSGVLIALYCGYLWLLNRIPPEEEESTDEMEAIPRAIVTARPAYRNAAILGLFIVGGGLIFIVAEPFLGSLLSVAATVGISQFVAVQWIAPFVSEFPEKVSAFYWARSLERAPMALMNMVSSNVNQWTLLAASLPIVLSLGAGHVSAIHFDAEQSLELLMTAGQSLLGALLLLDMELAWWEATALFVLWVVQFGFSISSSATQVHVWITATYFVASAAQVVRLVVNRRWPRAIAAFREIGK